MSGVVPCHVCGSHRFDQPDTDNMNALTSVFRTTGFSPWGIPVSVAPDPWHGGLPLEQSIFIVIFIILGREIARCAVGYHPVTPGQVAAAIEGIQGMGADSSVRSSMCTACSRCTLKRQKLSEGFGTHEYSPWELPPLRG